METGNCQPKTMKGCDNNSKKKLSLYVQSGFLTGSTSCLNSATKCDSPASPKATLAADDSGSKPVSCTVCSRFDHAAMFNIFKCFCLAQRIFRTANLLQFRRCHLKSSYICEECVECLEVIEEVEIMKREFVQNFLQHCTIEALSTERPLKADSDASNSAALGIISENEMDSVISTPKADHESEVMFVTRLKRQMSMMLMESNRQDLLQKDVSIGQEQRQSILTKKWKVNVLTSPNELGGMLLLDPASLPTVRQLFTSHGLRRYLLLPPTKSNAPAAIQRKRRRCSELVQYLKHQTASKALLASVQKIEDADCKQTKKIRAQDTVEDNLPVCSVDKPSIFIKFQQAFDLAKKSSHNDRKNGDDDERATSEAAATAVPATVCNPSPVTTNESLETMPKSPADDLHIVLSGEDSIEIIDVATTDEDDDKPEATTCNHPMDDRLHPDAKNFIEEVVESFLHIEPDEIEMMVQQHGEALKGIFECESATSPEPVDDSEHPPVVCEPRDTVKTTRIATKRVAPIVRPIAPKYDAATDSLVAEPLGRTFRWELATSPKSGIVYKAPPLVSELLQLKGTMKRNRVSTKRTAPIASKSDATTDSSVAVTVNSATTTAASTSSTSSNDAVGVSPSAKKPIATVKAATVVNAATVKATTVVNAATAVKAATVVNAAPAVNVASNQSPQYAIISHATTSQQLMLVRSSDTGALIYVTPPLVTVPVQNICP